MMKDFVLYPVDEKLNEELFSPGLDHSFQYSGYILRYNGPGVKTINETGIYITGYVLPRNNFFCEYRESDSYSMIASLYAQHGEKFTGFIKGCFSVIIFHKGTVEVFFDHLGLFRAFYTVRNNRIFISTTAGLLKKAGIDIAFDRVSLYLQSLFHRVPLKYTVFRDIFKTTCGESFTIQPDKLTAVKYWEPESLIKVNSAGPSPDIKQLADMFRQNISNFNSFLKPSGNCITLTGGKDSRTILAALLNAGIKPVGLTYGSDKSRDAVYARLLAEKAGIEHVIVNPQGTKEWFESEADKIISYLNPEISLHRSLRLCAFSKVTENSPQPGAFYTGYMGGELLMGIYYDNLIFTSYQTKSWDSGKPGDMSEWLATYFHSYDEGSITETRKRIEEMKSMNDKYSRVMKSFYGIFEIGIPHHSQDIFLANKFWEFPYPAFIDIDFLELLFQSRYSFLNKNNKSTNPFKRYGLYTLNMHIQHMLWPGIDSVPFGKKGSYNNSEYLKGSVYWSIVKGLRYLTQRRKYPPSFSYGESYRKFILENLEAAVSEKFGSLLENYEIDKAITNIRSVEAQTSEGSLHRYSNIVMFYLMEKKLKNEI